MGRKRDVLVLDANGQFVEYVEPAVARRALKERVVTRARTRDCFAIQLPKGRTRVPRLFKGRGVQSMSFDKFSDLFAEEQPLYVKTLVPGQVSFEIQVGPGMVEPVRVPHSGDPVCLTNIAPFDAIKRCMDLRKLASPRSTRDGGFKPPAIRIMTEAEVHAHYAEKATKLGYVTPEGQPDIERASTPVYTEEAIKQPATRVDLPKSKSEEAIDSGNDVANLGDQPVAMAEVVHPRVLHICHELSDQDAPENRRMPADAVLTELNSLGDLNDETLNHILAYGYYKSVRTWATRQLQAKAEAAEE